MRSSRLRLPVGLGVVALALVTGGANAAPIPLPPTARPATILLRDAQASEFSLHPADACAQGSAGADCVQLDTEIEPSIAVNPADSKNAVAVFQSGRRDSGGDATNGWATTFDGGQTWSHGLLPGLTKDVGGPFGRASDAVVAFGPDNIVYANSLVFDLGQNDTGLPDSVYDPANSTTQGNVGSVRSGLAVNVSHDGGRTWGAPVFFQDDMGGGTIDKNWIVVDTSDAPGHHKGRVYVVWDRIVPILATYSDDEGTTWAGGSLTQLNPGSESPQPVTGGVGYVVAVTQGIGAIPLVMPNGDFAVVFADGVAPVPVVNAVPGDEVSEPLASTTRYVIAVAKNAGSLPTRAPLVFEPKITIADYEGNTIRNQRGGDGLETAAVDPNDGTLYVAWNDARFRTDNNDRTGLPSTAGANWTFGGISGVNDVVVVRSTDGGVTWSSPMRVNPGPTDDHVDHYDAMLGVGDDGSVRIGYRRRQEAASDAVTEFSRQIDTYYQVSYNHGDTWSAPLKVNTPAGNAYFAAQSRGGSFLGDYDQLAPAGDLTYIVRTEAVRANPSEPEKWVRGVGPVYHHQRTWVAVVGPAAVGPLVGAPKPPKVLGKKVTKPTTLPTTGTTESVGLALVMIAASLGLRRRLRVR